MSEVRNPHNPVPWLPEEPFWETNSGAVADLFDTMRNDYPEASVPKLKAGSKRPSLKTQEWMFARLLGHQHGSMEGNGGKVIIPRTDEYKYWPDLSRIRYGEHHFTVPTAIDGAKEYSKSFVLSGTQEENIDRLMALQGYNPSNDNVREIIIMAGQRLRGIWEAPGEKSLEDLLDTTARLSGADMDELGKKSPFVKQQSTKTGTEWDQPFATEYEMCRLAAEAVFQEQIDWANYPVRLEYDETANPQSYISPEGPKTVPAREELQAVYAFKDGRKLSVVNGKAIARPRGVPRPTSDSTARETIDLVEMNPGEHIVIASSVPHARAGIDALVRILAIRGSMVNRADIVTGKWLPWKELTAGLGEIPATHQADMRLRTVLAGKDPDTKASLAVEAIGSKVSRVLRNQ